jgi:hypothetical protein
MEHNDPLFLADCLADCLKARYVWMRRRTMGGAVRRAGRLRAGPP